MLHRNVPFLKLLQYVHRSADIIRIRLPDLIFAESRNSHAHTVASELHPAFQRDFSGHMISLRPCKRNQLFDRFRRNARSDQDLDPSVASSHQLTQKFPTFPRRIFLSACQDRSDS